MATKDINNKLSKRKVQEFRGQLLDWYDRHRRELPWRARDGVVPDPYHVWLSEIMLQQTTVGAVGPYFTKFLQKWPDVHALANAPQEDLMAEWAGLGYYARARNLHKCAKIVSGELNGIFPQDKDELQKLPGVGDYTSAAVAAIAFNKPATVVDGNIERVMARIFAVTDPVPKSKPHLKTLAHKFFDKFDERPGDLAQAMMDLGATVCIAKTPRCALCPVSDLCHGYKQDIAATLPRRIKKKPKPQKHGYIYWATNNEGEVLLHRRPEKGLLGGTLALPTSDWLETSESVGHLRMLSDSDCHSVSIHHSFTHFDLELKLHNAKLTHESSEYFWQKISLINPSDFPTVFKKALKIFLQETQ